MPTPDDTSQFCPYVGLQPFSEEQADYFFGRARDQRVIFSNLSASPLTILYGQTGVGKSSVLQAGVVSFVRKQKKECLIYYFKDWQGTHFGEALKKGCQAEAQRIDPDLAKLDRSLLFDEFLLQIAKSVGQPFFIILDQFEEYFLYHSERETGSTFDCELARAINRHDVRVHFLISLREDALAKLDRFQKRIPNLLGNMLRIEHLDANNAREAIRGPLAVYRKLRPQDPGPVEIGDVVVEEIVQKARKEDPASMGSGSSREQQPIEVAYLQMVMTRLWFKELAEKSRTIRIATLSDKDKLGGVRNIIDTHLDDAMRSFSAEEKRFCVRFFLLLVGGSGGKYARETADLVSANECPPEQIGQAKDVLEKLAKQLILRPLKDPEGYEIRHDVLAPTILSWRTRQLLKQAQDEVAQKEQEAARQREQEQAQLLAREQEKSRQRELEQTRKLAEEQKSRADERARAVTRIRVLAIAAAAVALLALFAARSAFNQRNEARRATLQAESNQLAVVVSNEKYTGASARAAAKYFLDASTKHSRPEEIPDFESADETELEVDRTNRFLFPWHALLAYRQAMLPLSAEINEALRSALVRRVRVELKSRTVIAMAFKGDGKSLVTVGTRGNVDTWSTQTGTNLSVGNYWPNPPIHCVFASAASHFLAVWQHGAGVVYDVSGNGVIASNINGIATNAPNSRRGNLFDSEDEPDPRIAVSRNGTLVAFVNTNGAVMLGRPLLSNPDYRSLPADPSEVVRLVFNPEATRLAILHEDGGIRIHEVDGKPRTVRISPLGLVSVPKTPFAWSNDGKWLATAESSGLITLWDAASGKQERTFTPSGPLEARTMILLAVDAGRVVGLQRGDELSSGIVHVWDFATGTELFSVPLESDPDMSDSYVISPDMQSLAIMNNDLLIYSLNGTANPAPELEIEIQNRGFVLTLEGYARVLGELYPELATALACVRTNLLDHTNFLEEAVEHLKKVEHLPGISFSWPAITNELNELASRRLLEQATNAAASFNVAQAGHAFRRARQIGPARSPEFDPDTLARSLALDEARMQAELLEMQGDTNELAVVYRRAGSLDPSFSEAALQQKLKEMTLRAALQEATNAASDLDLNRATEAFRRAQSLDPDLGLDPDKVARVEILAFARDAADMAELFGDTNRLVSLYRKAARFDPSFHEGAMEASLRRIGARQIVARGVELANEKRIPEAVAAFEEARSIAPQLKISASDYNSVCWRGSLLGYATNVLFAGEEAVKISPNDAAIRDTRGLARALTGNILGAIEDFEFYVRRSRSPRSSLNQRRDWIQQLRAGRSPQEVFSEEVRMALLDE